MRTGQVQGLSPVMTEVAPWVVMRFAEDINQCHLNLFGRIVQRTGIYDDQR